MSWGAQLIEHILTIVAGKVPFFIMTNAQQKPVLNGQRLVEAAIIGGVLALLGYVFVVPRLEERITSIQEDVRELKRSVTGHLENGHPGMNARIHNLELNDREEKRRVR